MRVHCSNKNVFNLRWKMLKSLLFCELYGSLQAVPSFNPSMWKTEFANLQPANYWEAFCALQHSEILLFGFTSPCVSCLWWQPIFSRLNQFVLFSCGCLVALFCLAYMNIYNLIYSSCFLSRRSLKAGQRWSAANQTVYITVDLSSSWILIQCHLLISCLCCWIYCHLFQPVSDT